MSGLKRRDIFYRFSRCELWMKHEVPGAKIVNPCRVWMFRWPWLFNALERVVGHDAAYTLVLLYDLWLLSRCQRLHIVGSDWSTSRGAQTEFAFAQKAGINITMDVTTKQKAK